MSTGIPKVAIGLPVYNAVNYITQALDSLLDQSYSNFTIFILDNCSDDGTSKICEAYAKSDNRIKYLKNSKNIGAAKNYHKIIESVLPISCDYFMFARSEAILSKKLISEMVNALEKYRDVVLAFPRTVWINEQGEIIREKPIGFYDTRGCEVEVRVALTLWMKPFPIYGLMRSEIIKSLYKKTWWQTIGFDHVFLLDLALRGSFHYIENELWYRRYKYKGETYKKRLKRYRKNLLYKSKIIDYLFPLIKLPYYLLATIINSDLSFIAKMKCLIVVSFTTLLRYMVSKGKQI